jgi:hypothetical protein
LLLRWHQHPQPVQPQQWRASSPASRKRHNSLAGWETCLVKGTLLLRQIVSSHRRNL